MGKQASRAANKVEEWVPSVKSMDTCKKRMNGKCKDLCDIIKTPNL